MAQAASWQPLEFQKGPGRRDLSVWLQSINEDQPVLYPYWRRDCATVVLEALAGQLCFGVVLDRATMLAMRLPSRLWFCAVPPALLVEGTTAQIEWFQ